MKSGIIFGGKMIFTLLKRTVRIVAAGCQVWEFMQTSIHEIRDFTSSI
jgi:hypothetical protein